jgi:hypothetical protein
MATAVVMKFQRQIIGNFIFGANEVKFFSRRHNKENKDNLNSTFNSSLSSSLKFNRYNVSLVDGTRRDKNNMANFIVSYDEMFIAVCTGVIPKKLHDFVTEVKKEVEKEVWKYGIRNE